MSKSVNVIKDLKTKEKYALNDARIPEPTVADAGKALGVNAQGELAYINASGPGPTPTPAEPPVKGDLLVIDNKLFRVLEADGWNCKLMCMDLVHQSYSVSPETTTFLVDGIENEGIKYAGSDLDVYCNETFLATLPQEVQDAIIEEETVQEMYQNVLENPGDFGVEQNLGGNPQPQVYRVKKVSDESVIVGNRKCHSLSFKELIEYLGSQTTAVLIMNFCFRYTRRINEFHLWLMDANVESSLTAFRVAGDGAVNSTDYAAQDNIVFPVFKINLEHINFGK